VLIIAGISVLVPVVLGLLPRKAASVGIAADESYGSSLRIRVSIVS
jgi:hypothetical protein